MKLFRSHRHKRKKNTTRFVPQITIEVEQFFHFFQNIRKAPVRPAKNLTNELTDNSTKTLEISAKLASTSDTGQLKKIELQLFLL